MEHEQKKDVPDPPLMRAGRKRTVAPERPPLTLPPTPPASLVVIGGEAWYEANYASLLRLAHTLVEREHAQDVVQEAVAKFIRQCEQRPWTLPVEQATRRLAAMVQDVVKDHYRKQERESRLMQEVSGTRAASRRWSTTSRSAADREIRQAIRNVLIHVSKGRRKAWIAVKEQGYSIKEAAAALGKSEGTIRNGVYETNQILQENLRLLGLTPDMLRGRDDA